MTVSCPSEFIGQAGRARVSVAVIFLINGVVLGSWAPHIPLVQQRLGISAGMLGAALLAMATGALAAMPIAGYLVDRKGSAPVTRVSSLVFCASLPLPILAPDIATLIAALVLYGGANGAMDVAMNAHAVAVERALGRPVMSSFHGMFSIGGFAGAGLGGVALAFGSIPGHAFAVTALTVILTIVASRRLLSASTDGAGASPHFVWPRRATLGLGFLAFLSFMGEGAMLDWSAVYLNTSLLAGSAVAGFGYAAFSATMAVGRFAGDSARLRFGAPRLAGGGALLAAAGIGLAVISDLPNLAVAGFAMAGLGFSNIVPVLFGAAGRVGTVAPATSIAAVATLGYAGFLAGPPVIGFVAEAASLRMGLAVVAVGCLVVMAASGLVRSADAPAPGD